RPLLEWSGRVDREVRITVHDRDVWVRGADDRDSERRPRLETALPLADGAVSVRVEEGRGDVDVIQQPSSRNDYTAIIRVRDRSGGADRYRVRAYWVPLRDGWYDRGRDDRDRDRDRNRDRDRDRDRGQWGGGRGDRTALHWSGEVDGEVEIWLRGDRVSYRRLSGHELRGVRSDVSRAGLPMSDVDLYV